MRIIIMNDKIFGAIQVCQILGIPKRRLDYLHQYGYLDAPKKNFAGHRIYTDDDLVKIKDIELLLNQKRLDK